MSLVSALHLITLIINAVEAYSRLPFVMGQPFMITIGASPLITLGPYRTARG